MTKALIVAEIGCNHKGDINIAKEMIRIAADYCRVDVVKFQKRCIKELLTKEEYNAPHPNQEHSYGENYGKHRDYLELNIDQHTELKEYAESFGVEYSSSVWSITAAKEVASLKPSFIKVPSACNTDYKMLNWLLENYKGDIHLSFGMTTKGEELEIVGLFEKHKRIKDLVIYACTSGYPVAYEDTCLLEIQRLRDRFGGICKSIGFSSHNPELICDLAAVAMGAKVIEKHFTLLPLLIGTDHQASACPYKMKELVSSIRKLEKAMTYKKKEILPVEEVQRKKLKRFK